MSGGGRCAPGQIAAWNECSVASSVNSVWTCWKEDEADIFVSGVSVRAVGGKVGVEGTGREEMLRRKANREGGDVCLGFSILWPLTPSSSLLSHILSGLGSPLLPPNAKYPHIATPSAPPELLSSLPCGADGDICEDRKTRVGVGGRGGGIEYRRGCEA